MQKIPILARYSRRGRFKKQKAGEEFAELWLNAHTVAAGIRVPAAVGDFMILDAIRESNYVYKPRSKEQWLTMFGH